MPPDTPSTTMICSMPRPAIDMMVSSSSSPGNAIQASTKRCVTRSRRPPMKPVVPPISTATTTVRTVAASPTVSDSRAPWMRRLSRSRPTWSVPSRYAAVGACRRSRRWISS